MGKGTFHGPRRRSVDFESLWLITFADLMVQLMAFFAVIYSFSVQDKQKLNQVLDSFKREVGLAPEARRPVIPSGPITAGKPATGKTSLESLLSDLQAIDGPDVGTRMRLVTFRGSILFAEGSADVDPVFDALLERIVKLSRDYPGYSLVCEGYAAPDEVGEGAVDVWELSGMRAQAIVRYLVSQGTNPGQVSAEAKGDAIIEGDAESPEGRALQRRVKFRYQRPSTK